MKTEMMLLLIACFKFIYTSNAALSQQVATFPLQDKTRILAVMKKECVTNNADFLELLQTVREGKYREDEEFQTFIHCAFKSTGYTYDNGRVKTEKAAALFPYPDLMLKVMNKCDEESSNPIETTFQFFKCFQKTTPYFIGL